MFTTIEEVQALARTKNACQEALDWLKTQPNPKAAWETCERPDWMIWLAVRRNIDRKTIVRIACACARTSLRFVLKDETRPLKAIETAEAWCDGNTTIDDVRKAGAASAAADAAYAASAADAVYAADAAYAASAASAAAYAVAAASAAAYAAYAAYAVAAAADAAYADAAAARLGTNWKMAAIVRQHISFEQL